MSGSDDADLAGSTQITGDPRRGAPDRADAEPWPEVWGDVEAGVWYQLDFGMTSGCGPYFLVPGQSRTSPNEVVFVADDYYNRSKLKQVAHAQGVGRINAGGDLEYTVDGVQDVVVWTAVPGDEFADGDLFCDDQS